MSTCRRNRNSTGCLKPQSGAALLVILIVVILTGAAIFVTSYNPSRYKVKTNKLSSRALQHAKDALLGWAVTHPDTPGMLPWPDHPTDGNYDGNSDCLNQAPAHTNLSGRLPWLGQTAPCVAPLSGLGIQALDGSGQRFWYAASPNLVYDYSTNQPPAINSNTRNLGTGWLTVRDSLGNVLSNKVAFVVIAPGRVVGSQVRNGSTPAIGQFLDSATINGSTYSNADSNGVFVSAPHSDTFNDVLIYATVDELMDKVEKVVGKDKTKCENYYGVGDPKCAGL